MFYCDKHKPDKKGFVPKELREFVNCQAKNCKTNVNTFYGTKKEYKLFQKIVSRKFQEALDYFQYLMRE